MQSGQHVTDNNQKEVEKEAAVAKAEAEVKIREEVEKEAVVAKARAEAEKIKKEILLNGEGSKINEQDLASLYKLHKELESKGIKLKITGSFAARLAIYFYNPDQKEIAKLFSVNDLDLVIAYYKDYLNSIRNYENYDLDSIKEIISNNGYDVKNEKTTIETPDYINLKRTKPNNNDGIDFDLSVEKSPLNSVDKFMPFHFLHLEMIEEDQIKKDDKIISIGEYHFKLCVKTGFEKEIEKACKFAEIVVLKPEDNFRHYSYSVFKYLAKISNCVKYLEGLSNGSPNNVIENVIKQHFTSKDKDDTLILYYIYKSQTKTRLFYEEMKRFAIGILEGKSELARPFIQNFYFVLLLNEVGLRENWAQTKGYLFTPPSVDKLRQLSSECADLFINNNHILENAHYLHYPFNKWKKDINNITFRKLDEYEQGYKDQLVHQPYLIQEQQEYQSYQPQKCQQFLIQQQQAYQQVLTQQQQKCQQFLIQRQHECQQFLIQQQQENQPCLAQQQEIQQFLIQQQQKCQQFLIQQRQENKQFLFQQQQECQQFLAQQKENQQFLIQQHQHNQQFLFQQHQHNQQFLIQQSQQYLLQQTQFYLNVVQQQREYQQRHQSNERQQRQQTNLNQQQSQPLSNSLSVQTPAFYPQIQRSNLTLPHSDFTLSHNPNYEDSQATRRPQEAQQRSTSQFYPPQLQHMQFSGLSQSPYALHSVPRQPQQMQSRLLTSAESSYPHQQGSSDRLRQTDNHNFNQVRTQNSTNPQINNSQGRGRLQNRGKK